MQQHRDKELKAQWDEASIWGLTKKYATDEKESRAVPLLKRN